ncbi:acyltransferase family protein [Sciscionella sediminilitoris]|uniref:acyltransferase family protein n=1 Tax=Sciscionella sediminilitoris TaxID=1445613 RepID=UPI0004DF7FC0|nr:acyltransferase [Sciscionella sp. SE31]
MTQVQHSARATSRSYLPALDGVRGVAILGVLLFHTGHLDGGFLGVDLFFALSGYLITDLLLREAGRTGTVSLLAFWGRRIRRLLPALASMLAVVTLLVWLTGTADVVRTTLADGPWVQANLQNWHLLAESAGYWDRFGAARMFEHLWSIAVEEQFYVLWPVLVLGIAWFGRRLHRRVALAAVLISVVSLVLMLLLFDPADPSRVYTGTDTRAFSLLLGALVATRPVRERLARLSSRAALYLAVSLIAGLVVLWLAADGQRSSWLYSGGLFAHSAAAALLIGLCAQFPGNPVASALGNRALRWIGRISYSLYLWHMPVFLLLSAQRTGLTGWPWALLVCLVAIAAAALSKYLIEDPIRFRVTWSRGRSGVFAFAAVLLGLALLWILLPAPAPASIDLGTLG